MSDKSKDELSPHKLESLKKKLAALRAHKQQLTQFMLKEINDPEYWGETRPEFYGDAIERLDDKIEAAIAEALGPVVGPVWLENLRLGEAETSEQMLEEEVRLLGGEPDEKGGTP